MTGVKAEDQLPTLGGYLRPLVHFRVRLLALMLLGTLVGGLLAWSTDVRYESVSTVELAARPVAVDLSLDGAKERSVSLDTLAALVQSDPAVDRMATAMGINPTRARADLAVTARPLSRVLVVTVRGESPEQVTKGSAAATAALLELEEELLSVGRPQIQLVRQQVNVLRAQTIERAAEGESSSVDESSLATMEARLQQITDSTSTHSRILQDGSPVRYREGNPAVTIASGAGLGLLLALVTLIGAPVTAGSTFAEQVRTRRVTRMRWRPIRRMRLRRRGHHARVLPRSSKNGEAVAQSDRESQGRSGG